ncbi:transposase family protein [Streptomyces pseudogriseolus]|uniref:transposase family protein n=1 Tax=Streptomyces pseudogriseolus TaxID=36817 RepID=UPI003FA263F3|nr:transposase family protein [Streptomyces pseudogriseolus]
MSVGAVARRVRDRGGNGTLRGRPWCLPLAERVLVVAVYYRTNLTMRQLGPLFGIPSSTVCRVIQGLGPLLALEPVSRPGDAADRLWIVDGTLVPVRDRKVGSSSCNYRFSANVQVIVDADTVLADGACLNCGMVTPHRRRPRRELLPGEGNDNAAHRKVRARVEHVICRMKNYKILRDCRQHGDGLHHAVQAVAYMHNLALAS